MSRIVDEKGIWVTNIGEYPMQDPISNTRIEAGERVQVTHTDWIKLQASRGCIQVEVVAKPMQKVEVKAEVKSEAKKS